jgi:RNA polymerase sigma-70 factor, ECF subfamily
LEDRQAASPSQVTFRAEVRKILERRIDELPLAFRTVFVMRDVQDMSVHETADALGIPEPTVRTRLFRARAMLREALQQEIDDASIDVFSFAGDRCDRIVATVIQIVSSEA